SRLVEDAPQATFTIAGSPLVLPLFADTPRLEALIPMEKRPHGRHWFDLWRQVRGRRWGLVLDMRGSGLARVLRARRRAIRHAPHPGAAPVHKVLEAAHVLRLDDDPPAPRLYVGEETAAAAARLLAKGSGPVLAIAPAANWVGKAWAGERFGVLASRLLGEGGPLAGGRLLVLGAPGDRPAAEAARRGLPRAQVIDAVGRVDLLTAYAALQQARLFVGNDSGLMHMAAAAGAPTLGLFGPSDERLYAPWGPKGRAIRGKRSFADFLALDPELNQALPHMRDLSVEAAFDAAAALIRDTEADFDG
ncbi:MAG: glycosyltransferase family 9 protein, partial [Caulobacteraceae bacterium]|nr:glycosyltransferase family 9 protein [Caulobacter sp.]